MICLLAVVLGHLADFYPAITVSLSRARYRFTNKRSSAQRDVLAEAKLGALNENEGLLGECQCIPHSPSSCLISDALLA